MNFDAKSEFLSENAFLRPHVADAYKTNEINQNGCLFGPKSIFEPKVRFGPQNRLLGPKIE